MRRSWFPATAIFAITFLFSVSHAFSVGPLRWTVDVKTGMRFGHTSYLLDEPDPASIGVRSELIFPMDTPVVGLRVGLENVHENRRGWWMRINLTTGLGNPFSLMSDGDWYLYQDYPPIPFSYTESEAKLRTINAGVQGGLDVFRRDWLILAATLLYRFQWIEQTIVGYEGWQYADTDLNGEFELYVISSTARTLDYWIVYHLPAVGLSLRVPLQRLQFEVMAAYTLFFVADRDDHLLRYKLSTAEGLGHGVIASAEARYLFRTGRLPLRPYFEVSADLMALRADLEQTQQFYAGPDAGLVLRGISHLITSSQLTASIRLGFSY